MDAVRDQERAGKETLVDEPEIVVDPGSYEIHDLGG